MIQRKQNLYLIIVIAALAILTLGSDVFVTTVKKENQFEIINHGNVYGVQKDLVIKGRIEPGNKNKLMSATGRTSIKGSIKGIPTFYIPFYSITIILTVLAAATLFSYKNLKRQFRLMVFLMVFTLLLFVGANIMSYVLENNSVTHVEGEIVQSKLGMGFYCICVAGAFSFLAFRGIKRDLKLIKSIERLR